MLNLKWYPMRVTYHRELKIKEQLDILGIENFVPMRYEIVETKQGRKKKLVSAIHNLIFVHSTQEALTHLKMTRKGCEPMRYMMKPVAGNRSQKEIMTVPDHEMHNFMRVASVQDDSVMFLDYNDFIGKEGSHVRITGGTFAGVEGVIKRIKKNKHVVVQVEGIAAVAVTFVPPSLLQPIN